MNQMITFIEKAMADEDLMAKLDELGKADAPDEEIITLAAEYEFTITKKEIEAMKNQSCSSCKSCEIGEDELGNVAGGNKKETQNRYDLNVCPNLTRTRYECVGLLNIVWCDHYRRTRYNSKFDLPSTIYIHECAMGAFNYKGFDNGNPE